jgi:hypothetical protein
MVVAMAGDEPVCSARIEFLPGTSFASLWGGGPCPAGAAGESTAPWSPTAPSWPPPGATVTCTWTHPLTASPSWPASSSAAWPAPRPMYGITAQRSELESLQHCALRLTGTRDSGRLPRCVISGWSRRGAQHRRYVRLRKPRRLSVEACRTIWRGTFSFSTNYSTGLEVVLGQHHFQRRPHRQPLVRES